MIAGGNNLQIKIGSRVIGGSLMRNGDLLSFKFPKHEEGAEGKTGTGKEKHGETVPINNKHTKRGGSGHSQTRCQHQISQGASSIFRGDNSKDRRQGSSIYACECDPLKKPGYQKRKEWAECN